ncbi:MAG: ABC transporter ATP-binding protein [Lachnospiraceae bacterium]|nr:ABC transporter ATP-binding protein [Lachnospiraceae bacterium]
MEYVLETTDLSKIYGKKKAVNKVNMHVKKGDIYGFIGKNGAGKTTLMKMVTGLAKASEGSIKLFGSEDLTPQRARIGSLIEAPGIYGNMTGKENVEYFRKLYGIKEKEETERVLSCVGLDVNDKKKARNFSLGMKQRLGIAISLLGHPDFLILDEPINGLDPAGIKEVRDLVLKLNKEQEITLLISSHILGELSKIATTYGIIKQGTLVEEFSKETLVERCKRCIKIQVDDTKQATNILETVMGIHEYEVLPNQEIRIFSHLEEIGDINTLLVENKLKVTELRLAGQDLEGYFMDLLGGEIEEE